MHGVRRTKVTPASLEAQRVKEQSKIAEYRSTVDDLLSRKASETYDSDALALTANALKLNPELYTAWNYRRLILLKGIFPKSSPEDVHALLLADLNLTTLFLKSLPKVYWIWTHRTWCLANIPAGPPGNDDPETWRREAWERELKLVEKMLTVDARNFHAWDYRRLVLKSLPLSAVNSRDSELGFTKRKIESNFSNYSAWHQRGKVLGEGLFSSEAESNSEFELVSQALWTDPNDQSSWLYHRFLISKTSNDPVVITREIKQLKELLEVEPEAKWPLDTLVHYTLLLLRDSSPPAVSSPEERERMIGDVRGWLDLLGKVDPGRRERYKEIATEVPSA